MKKSVIFGMLVILLAIGFIGCPPDGNEDEEFSVTFDLDGGNISGNTASVEIKVKSGETIADLPDPKKSDNDFEGWFSQKNGAGNQFTSSSKVTSNLNVYAKWTLINKQQSLIEGKWFADLPDPKKYEMEDNIFLKFSNGEFLLIVYTDGAAAAIDFDTIESDDIDKYAALSMYASGGTYTENINKLTITFTAAWDGEWYYFGIDEEVMDRQPYYVNFNFSISGNKLSLDYTGSVGLEYEEEFIFVKSRIYEKW